MATQNTKKFELKIGKTGVLIILGGMTGLLCAAFLLGVDIGKNIETSPGEIASLPQKALAMVWRPAKIKMAEQNVAQTGAPGPLPAEDNIDLTYHDTLMKKKGLDETETFPEKTTPEAKAINEEELLKGKFHIETAVPIKPEAITPSKEEPAKKEMAALKESSPSPAGVTESRPDQAKFIVQVASLKDKSTAYRITGKIAALGFQTKIVKIDVKGQGSMFRVFATGFKEKSQAQQAVKKINARTGMHCIIKKVDGRTN